jgi:hypothetical protein
VPPVTKHYEALIDQLHDLLLLAPASWLIKLDDGARAIREQLETKHLELMRLEGLNKRLAGHLGKYNGYFVRLCLTWHCIEHPRSPPPLVSEHTARRVAEFMHGFLFPHALAFYVNVFGMADEQDRLTAVAGYILAHKLDRLTNRHIQRGDRTMRKLSRRDTDAVCEQLNALGWLLDPLPAKRRGGVAEWPVNPEAHRLFAERAQLERERRGQLQELIKAQLARKGQR